MLVFSNRLLSVVLATVALAVSCHGVVISRSERISKEHQTRIIIRDCLSQLEVQKPLQRLTRGGFASLVESLSHGEVGGSHGRLPLQFSTVFNMNACLNGKDCIGDHAFISITSEEERALTCSSISSLLSQSITLVDDDGACETTTGENETSVTCPVDVLGDIKGTMEEQ